MAKVRGAWINLIGGIAGAIVFAIGIIGLLGGFSAWSTFLAALGFVIMSWAALDYRRFVRGMPESEVDGGKVIE